LKSLIALCALACACHLAHPVQGQEIYFYAALSGTAASPPNSSAGAGTALVYVDLSSSQLHFDVNFSSLEGVVTGAHLHGLTAMPGMGVAAAASPQPNLDGFATGFTSGLYHGIFDLNLETTYDPAFLAAFGGTVAQASNALLFGLTNGHMYFDIHTDDYPNGEISGFVAPAPTADFDHNGRVDAADLNLWTIGFGPGTFADADHDNATNGDDFLLWQRQLGSVAEIPHHHHATDAGQAVPEPASLGAAVAAFATLAACRRRTRPL
jgi:CHRD domain